MGADANRERFTRAVDEVRVLFAAAALNSVDDLVHRFVPNFYFGCEADDRLVAWAFNERVNAGGARLRPISGSDVSHWDVVDMTDPVREAFELVEDGVIGQPEFRELTFLNRARLHAGMNPDFFKGTVCDDAVRTALANDGG